MKKPLSSHDKGKIGKEAKDMAQEIRTKLGIHGPIGNIFELAENKLSSLIAAFPSSDHNFSGFIIKMSGHPCIYINSSHTLGRQIFSCAHELCHWFYDLGNEHTITCFEDERGMDAIEYRAESFASHFLMPDCFK